MKREIGLEEITPDPASVVTVGSYDGVHVGHQAIIQYLLERARARDGVSVVVTFDPHPRTVVHGEAVPLLTTVEERAEVLEQLGLDRFIVVPFTREFARLEAEAYVEEVLVGRIGLREIVVGYDHAFGRGRRGDRALLEALGRRHGFSVDVIPAQVIERHVVSSSEIRQQLEEGGDVALAAAMLGRPYALTGTVVPGDRRGRLIGFPTANLLPVHPQKLVPRNGVYAVRATLPDGTRRGGMMNIGVRPTFDGAARTLEVHLFDFEGDLYEQALRVEFVERTRDERRFDGVEALVEQLTRDAARCKSALERVP